jgi:hypothetical protein
MSVAWERLGVSAEGRPIEFLQFGGGRRQVLVVGSLEGDRPEGLELAAHLARFPGAGQRTCTTKPMTESAATSATGAPARVAWKAIVFDESDSTSSRS